jgi:hypothetical protein
MSEELDRLKDIGAQKIYEDTHIPVEHVQAVLYESFEGLTKVQFIGFLSILEREYGEDLSAIRARGIGYFAEKSMPNELITDDSIFISSKRKKNLTIIYILLAIAVFATAIYFTTQAATNTLSTHTKENKIIQNIKNEVIAEDDNVTDTNATHATDENVTQAAVIKKVVEEPKVVIKSFEITAKTKVWLGYIDVQTNKKYQKTFTGNFELDPTKEWLMIFGHGYLDITIDGETQKFSDKNTLRLLYKDGAIKKITTREFKELNRGYAW